MGLECSILYVYYIIVHTPRVYNKVMAQKRQQTLSNFFSKPPSKKRALEDGLILCESGGDRVAEAAEIPVPVTEDVRESMSLEDSSCLDIGCVSNDVTNEEKYKLICERKPQANCKMPHKVYKDIRRKSGTTFRSCNLELFDIFEFLAFSRKKEGVYCLACVLFPSLPGKAGAHRAKLLITRAFDDWKDSKSHLKAHAQLQYHLDSEAKMKAFIHTMKNPSTRIDFKLNDERNMQVKKNCAYLRSIIKCLEFAGHEGIALRGHRDDATSESEHKGKFKALIDF